MRLNTIKPAKGATHASKRVGRGIGSGHGKTAGRGHKGQKARSGGSIRLGFEGGQMPLHRKMPKRGFNNAEFKTVYAVVNVSDLERFDAGTTIDEAMLRAAGLVRGTIDGVKILGDGELTKNLSVNVTKVTGAAREKIEKAGGSIASA